MRWQRITGSLTLAVKHLSSLRKNTYPLALLAATVFFCISPAWSAVGIADLEAKLARQERRLGDKHPSLAATLDKLGSFYQAQGRNADAEAMYRRALAIQEKRFGPGHLQVATSANHLGNLFHHLKRDADAEPFIKRALAIRESKLGAEHLEVAQCLVTLADIYRAQGHLSQAEPLYERALAIRKTQLGPEHLKVATTLNRMGLLYKEQARFADAEQAYKRAQAIWEMHLGPVHPKMAVSLANLAQLYQARGQFTEAEQLYQRALRINENYYGPDRAAVASDISSLATLYTIQGRYAEAEPLFKRALGIYERQYGGDHPDVATGLKDLAKLYLNQGRYAEAEPLFKRAIVILEKQLGGDHPRVAKTIGQLASLYRNQRRYDEAESLFKRALEIKEKTYGPDHPTVAYTLNDLAELYRRRHRYAEAEPLLKRALAINERRLGPEHRAVASNLNNLGMLYRSMERYADAEPLLRRSLDLVQKWANPDNPVLAKNFLNLAFVLERQGRDMEALAYTRHAFQIYRTRFADDDGDTLGEQSEKHQVRTSLMFHLGLLTKATEQSPRQALELGNEAFEASQLAQASVTGDVVARMAARFAADSDTLAKKVRERQDKINWQQKLDAEILKAATLEPDARNLGSERQLQDKLATVTSQIEQLDLELATNFPAYAELTTPKPLRFADVQKLLAPEEALLTYAIARNESYLFVIRADRAELIRLPPGDKALTEAVQHLRQRLDPARNAGMLPFDAKAAHALYQQIFAPAEPYLAGVRHVMLVPDRALQSLPLGVLVSATPTAPIVQPEDHRRVAWLARRYAFTTLPSVSSLRALRVFAKAKVGNQPFVGFGDPLLEGSIGKNKGLAIASALATRSIADVNTLRQASRLPETAEELEAMAQTMKVGESQLYLRERATETMVKTLDLSNTRILAFSTHGVMAGEMDGVVEPGLVLTPPKEGSRRDDGYLSASEIARLKLNADWVLLSACNTAAADGAPGAEGLSGLAKAFFYAGARSLLVSHWPVASEATKELQMTLLREYINDTVAGKAEALQRAELAVMIDSKNPEFAHPMFWAPFVVAGEGGARAGREQAQP